MSNQEEEKENTIATDVVNLVIARLETIPPNVQISIGNDGSFTIKELIQRDKNQDNIGKKMIEVQLNYLRSLSNLPTQEVKNVAAHN
jgi:hypothetical protein